MNYWCSPFRLKFKSIVKYTNIPSDSPLRKSAFQLYAEDIKAERFWLVHQSGYWLEGFRRDATEWVFPIQFLS